MSNILKWKILQNLGFAAAIIAISLFSFYKSFDLSLYGDSWLNLSWGVYGLIDFLHPVRLSTFQHFFTPYGSFDIFMGTIYHFAKFNQKPYFIAAFLLHTLAAFSLFPIAFYLSKNRYLAYLAVFFFSIASIGISAVDWVFNAPVYISTAFFNLFLFFFVYSWKKGKEVYMILSYLLFFTAYIFSPVRMTGLLPFAIFLEVFFGILNKSRRSIKISIIRILLLSAAVICVLLIGKSTGSGSYWTGRFLEGVDFAIKSITQGHYEFLFNPLIIFGAILFPTFILTDYTATLPTQGVFLLLLISYLIFTVFIITATLFIKSSRIYRKQLLVISLLFNILIFITHLIHKDTFSSLTNILSLIIGGFTLLFFAVMIFAYRKNRQVFLSIILSLTWSFFAFLPPWWWLMYFAFPTDYRYLVPAASGIGLLLMTLMGLSDSKTGKKFFIIFLCISIFIPHILADQIYFSENIQDHGAKLSNAIWSTMPSIVGLGKNNKKLVFYFTGDNGSTLNNVVLFGFSSHMMLLYKMRIDQPEPSASLNWNDIVSSVKDGIYIQTPGKPIPVGNVYAFRLDKERLINITPQIRIQLANELKGKK